MDCSGTCCSYLHGLCVPNATYIPFRFFRMGYSPYALPLHRAFVLVGDMTKEHVTGVNEVDNHMSICSRSVMSDACAIAPLDAISKSQMEDVPFFIESR
jgi:hypothetical protein